MVKDLEMEIGRKFVWGVEPKFTKQTELAFHEVNDISNLGPDLFLIPCSLSYRMFSDQFGANYHYLLTHERYNLPKQSLDPRVKTTVKSKMTEYLKDSFFVSNFNKIFLNQISFKESFKIVVEICKRSKASEEPKDNLSEQLEEVWVSVPERKFRNCEVSEFCESCEKSWLLFTKPVPHNVAFNGRQIKYICDLTIGGDVLELTNKLGISQSNCISCEFPIPNPNTDRGVVDSIQPVDNFGEILRQTKSNEYQKRNTKLSELFSENFKTRAKSLKGKRLTNLRKECHNYTRKATHSKSFEKVIKPDFHPMINNASKRILKKYLTSCRLADAHLLQNG